MWPVFGERAQHRNRNRVVRATLESSRALARTIRIQNFHMRLPCPCGEGLGVGVAVCRVCVAYMIYPPPQPRAIACGQFSANGRNIGIEIGSCAQLWNPAALSHARFESKISTCDCPALVGRG